MSMQYIPMTALHWPSSICNTTDPQQGWRSILTNHKKKKKKHLLFQLKGGGRVKGHALILSATKSSLLPETEEESEKTPADANRCSARLVSGSSRILHQPNTVGIIGGVSDLSTADFMRKLFKQSSEESEGSSLPVLLCSDPQLKQELSLGIELRSSRKKGDRVSNVLKEKILFLEGAGACCIVMPCHVSHAWYEELSQVCSVPFLHMGDCVAQELKEANLRPIETGSNVKIGLLGTENTMTAGFYQDRLSKQGFEVVVPDKATMEHVVLPALEALHRKDMEGARILLRIALQVLLVRAVSMVVLASYDMHSLLAPDDPLLKKCIDPIDTLARATINWSHSARNIT
ncbi:hypothetical protein SUGI_0918010 [Cryptomeria japonica]|uniref:uncharacterized protein LOC131061906 n=1 Tax=Cryptomeria japonica TaxID=3369 RepID=UPI00241475D8|nr:uncharacterized protein LOC131061906 [Cryptomeria japonica]GLJ44027.1 hypothetical protein SUGI_0918010 [Cryptomeria japonica]